MSGPEIPPEYVRKLLGSAEEISREERIREAREAVLEACRKEAEAEVAPVWQNTIAATKAYVHLRTITRDRRQEAVQAMIAAEAEGDR